MEFEYPVYEDAQAQPFFDFEAPKTSTDKNDDESAESMKAFYCTQPGCKKSFRYRSEILRHMVIHNNKRPYVCTYKNCMKGFKRSDALATHMRIHTREKTFECPYGNCKSTFSTKAGLKYHTLKHKSEKHAANQGKLFVEMGQNVNTNEDLFLEMGSDSYESSLENNFQEQYPMGENYYGYDASFDNTQIQPIAPFQFNEKAVCQEKNEFDTYLTTYSTPSNMSNNSEGYHFTNAPQKVMSCAANLINNTDDFGPLSMTKVDSNDKLFAMMQTIVKENSNLKKRLDDYQRFMTRGPQYLAEEQNRIF
jgi:uncharacterized Zn-finger protein